MQKNETYKDLASGYLYDRILKKTNNFDGSYRDTSKFRTAYYFRIKALILMGDFDHAARLCNEILEYSDNPVIINNANYFLSNIYFYKRDYRKALQYHAECGSEYQNKPKDFLSIISGLAARDPKVHDAVYCRDLMQLKECLVRDQGNNFKVSCGLLVDLVLKNFSSSRTYYDNYACFKIFKLNSVGIPNRGESTECSDYVKVIFKEDGNPLSIATMYPVAQAGDLEYTDITAQYNELNGLSTGSAQRSRAIDKFKQRQSLKKD